MKFISFYRWFAAIFNAIYAVSTGSIGFLFLLFLYVNSISLKILDKLDGSADGFQRDATLHPLPFFSHRQKTRPRIESLLRQVGFRPCSPAVEIWFIFARIVYFCLQVRAELLTRLSCEHLHSERLMKMSLKDSLLSICVFNSRQWMRFCF